MSDTGKLVLEARYVMAEGDDEMAIEFIDVYLEHWLYYKEHCPCCGTSDDI